MKKKVKKKAGGTSTTKKKKKPSRRNNNNTTNNNNAQTGKPRTPIDLRNKYGSEVIDTRINMSIPELIKSAQKGTLLNDYNLEYDLGDHLENKLMEMIEHKRETLAGLYHKLANDNIRKGQT